MQHISLCSWYKQLCNFLIEEQLIWVQLVHLLRCGSKSFINYNWLQTVRIRVWKILQKALWKLTKWFLIPHLAVSLAGLYCHSPQRSELFPQQDTADLYWWVQAQRHGRSRGWTWRAAWWKPNNSPPQTQASTGVAIIGREKQVGASEAR